MRTVVGLGIALLVLAGCKREEPSLGPEFAVYTPGDHIEVRIYDTYASVSPGAWTIEGEDKIDSPINSSQIACARSDGTCEDYRSFLTNVGGRWYLYAIRDTFTVTEWTPDRITATSTVLCRTIELLLSRKDQSVVELTTAAPDCKNALQPPLAKPRMAVLISGKQLDAQRGIKP